MKHRGLVWVLLVGLVLVNGLMAAPSAAHAEHHASHQAEMHATGLCAWLCAAGQSLEAESVQFTSILQLLDRLPLVRCNERERAVSLHTFVRGPPDFLK